MKKSEAKSKVYELLIKNGYIISTSIKPPSAKSPEDAISIQDKLSDMCFTDKGIDYCYQLRYEGDSLKLITVEV